MIDQENALRKDGQRVGLVIHAINGLDKDVSTCTCHVSMCTCHVSTCTCAHTRDFWSVCDVCVHGLDGLNQTRASAYAHVVRGECWWCVS
jgi:hypothetical protein